MRFHKYENNQMNNWILKDKMQWFKVKFIWFNSTMDYFVKRSNEKYKKSPEVFE
jgi:hypothetical protein